MSDATGPKSLRDLAGQTFHGWLVLNRAPDRYKRTMWWCRCVCGAEKSVSAVHLTRGATKSCGCTRPRGEQHHSYIHGKSTTALHAAWLGMIARCENPNHRSYSNYGGRGIRVCERWRTDFETFVADVGERPTPAHSLDRHPDKNGNYEPGNVRWATRKEQARNMRRNRMFIVDGVERTLAELVEASGLKYGTVKWRIENGVPIERALT